MFEKYICFDNKWEMDINSLKLMWCSTKNWIDTIWKFWTGLKYSIAVLMRNKIEFKIFIWKDEVKLDTNTLSVNGKDFERISIDGEESWFTTELWREWKTWQWVREFYSNCLDAEWEKLNWIWKIKGKEWHTRIFIKESDISEEMYRFQFENWIEVNDDLSYIKKESPSSLKVFKQWFLVYESYSEKSYFDYQINNVIINEARLVENTRSMKTALWDIQLWMDGHSILKAIEEKEYDIAQFSTGFDEYLNLSEAWIDILSTMKKEELRELPTEIREAYNKNKSRTSRTYSHGSSVIFRDKASAYVITEKGSVELLRDRTVKLFISWLSDKSKEFEILHAECLEIHVNVIYKKDFELYKNIAVEYLNLNDMDSIDIIIKLLKEKYTNK